jgi:hypothetical protein
MSGQGCACRREPVDPTIKTTESGLSMIVDAGI